MQKLYRLLVVELLLTMILSGCSPIATPKNEGTLKGNISISGAFAIYPLMIR